MGKKKDKSKPIIRPMKKEARPEKAEYYEELLKRGGK